MKIYFIYLLLCTCFLFACTPESTPSVGILDVEEINEAAVTTFDSLKAQEYGADAYGMRKYVIAFLKSGPNRDLPKAEADSLQAAHMANIGKMSDEGKLAIAGPFFEDVDLQGIYIFAVESLEEAQALTNSDPAIQAGTLVMELKEWYGSAALMAVSDIHGTLAKESF
ncbi:MAG: hypothetical protein ACI9RU_002434 [Litorivivens sp.]|jgi:uncharacterized protein YciI